MWQHRKLAICLLLLAGIAVLNIVAYNHAHSMTHFRADGSKTGRPESLSFSEKAQVLFLGVNVPRPSNRSDPGSQGLIFETQHFQGKDGINLEAWHIPQVNAKGTVLLLHGYAACMSGLLLEAKAFHDLGYSAVLLDHRGCECAKRQGLLRMCWYNQNRDSGTNALGNLCKEFLQSSRDCLWQVAGCSIGQHHASNCLGTILGGGERFWYRACFEKARPSPLLGRSDWIAQDTKEVPPPPRPNPGAAPGHSFP